MLYSKALDEYQEALESRDPVALYNALYTLLLEGLIVLNPREGDWPPENAQRWSLIQKRHLLRLLLEQVQFELENVEAKLAQEPIRIVR